MASAAENARKLELAERARAKLSAEELDALLAAALADFARTVTLKPAEDALERARRRLAVLQGAEGSQLNPKRSGSASSSAARPGLVPTTDTSKVLEGFLPHAKEDEVCSAAWAKLRNLRDAEPKEDDDEEDVVHPFLDKVFSAVAQAAHTAGLPCNKPFHDYKATNESGRPDWLFTRPNEQRHCASNTCFFVDAKAVATHRTNGKYAQTRDMLRREALAQLMRRLAMRHESTGYNTTHGVGVFSNGVNIQCLRINFQDDGTDVVFPAYVTEVTMLLGDGGAAAGADEPCPDGLRWVVRYMLEQQIEVFGLPAQGGFELPESAPYIYHCELGEGGFSIVSEYRNADDRFALKRMRHSVNDARLHHEREVLTGLAAAGVPRVPMVRSVLTSKTNQLGLLLTPVGRPLLEHIRHLNEEQRAITASALWRQLKDTLSAAHAAGFVHGDVRPSNVVVVPRAGVSEEHDFYLVDWGLGASSMGGSRQRKELFGVRAFMADELVELYTAAPGTVWRLKPEHDVCALLYTFAAVLDNKLGEPPWVALAYTSVGAATDMMTQRRLWMQHHITDAEMRELLAGRGGEPDTGGAASTSK